MKKVLFYFLILALLILFLFQPPAKTVQGAEMDGFVYEISGEAVTITGYTGSNENVIVPDMIDGKPVVAIGKNAFSSKSMHYVTLPDTVRLIGDYAFANCAGLIGVTFPSRLNELGQGAFTSCSQLGYTSSSVYPIVLPPGLTEIKSFTFSSCTNLLSVTLPEGITKIGSSAFSNCSRLISINLPSTVVRIEPQAFYYATDMDMPTFGPNINFIGREAFFNNRWLSNYGGEWLIVGKGQLLKYNGSATVLTLPDTVRRICSHAFAGKSSLKSVYLSDQVTEIDYFAFGYCYLQTVRIPPAVVTIETQAFQGNNGMIIQGYRHSAAQVFAEAHQQFDGFSFSELVRVQFDSLGGNNVPVQEVTIGSLLAEPTPPSRNGHVFLGWFTGLDFTTQWIFSTSAAETSTTLYANWRLPVPGGLKVNRDQATSASLTWNSQTGINGYEVYRSTVLDGSYVLIKTLSSTSLTDTGLSASTQYYYKIRSYSTANEIKFFSAMSQAVLAAPLAPSPTAAPSATTGTTAAASTVETTPAVSPTGPATPTATAPSTSQETSILITAAVQTTTSENTSATTMQPPQEKPGEPIPWLYFIAGFIAAGLLAAAAAVIRLKK